MKRKSFNKHRRNNETNIQTIKNNISKKSCIHNIKSMNRTQKSRVHNKKEISEKDDKINNDHNNRSQIGNSFKELEDLFKNDNIEDETNDNYKDKEK